MNTKKSGLSIWQASYVVGLLAVTAVGIVVTVAALLTVEMLSPDKKEEELPDV